MRERLQRRIIEINYTIVNRFTDAIENICNWTAEEIKNNDDVIKSLQDERRELRKILQKL